MASSARSIEPSAAGSSGPPRVVYVIPAYNEGRMIASVVRDLREHGVPGEIMVVDDASADDTADRARAAGATVLRHLINRGQGAALQTGFEAALRRGAQVVITFDADGQHCPEDTHALIAAITRHDVDVVLGSRFLEAHPDVPLARRMLLRCGIAFTRLVSRVAMTDTHNGLRAFRAEALRTICITEDRMAHASELIDLIAQQRLRYLEIPCRIRYTAYSQATGQRWYGAVRIVFDFLLGKAMR